MKHPTFVLAVNCLLFVLCCLALFTQQFKAHMQLPTPQWCPGNIIQSESLDAVTLVQLADLLRLTQVTVMALKAEIRRYLLWTQGDLAWATAMYAKYLEKWGVQVVVVRGETRGSIDQDAYSVLLTRRLCYHLASLLCRPCICNRLEVPVPHKVSYNYDLYLSQVFAGKVNYYLRNKDWYCAVTALNRTWLQRPYGTDYYENGDESGVRYCPLCSSKGILGVV